MPYDNDKWSYHYSLLTETFELPGVLVPYPEDGRDAKDQRRPSTLINKNSFFTINGKMFM